MDSFAHLWVTLGVVAASISILIFESLSICSTHHQLAELHPRSEGVLTQFLVLIGTITVLLYVVLLLAALYHQILRVVVVS